MNSEIRGGPSLKEQGVKDPEKRKTLERVGNLAVIGTVATALGLSGNEKSDSRPISAEEDAAQIPDAPRDALFARLSEVINKSRASESEKEHARNIAENLKTIVAENDKLFSLYNADVNDEGRQKLLVEYEKRFSHVGVKDPESLIYIVHNNKLAETQIINPLINLSSRQDTGSVFEALEKINQVIQANEGNPELSYYEGRVVDVPLKDYSKFSTKSHGEFDIGLAEGVAEEQISDYEEIKKRLLMVLGDRVPAGNIHVKLMPVRENYTEEQINDQRFNPHISGKVEISEDGDATIYMNSGSDLLLEHEVAHLMKIDRRLLPYFDSESFYRLSLKEAESLSDNEWGRNYPSIKKAFEKRKKSNSSTSSIRGDLPISVADYRKGDTDNYPDRIFFTGFYAGRISTFTENNFLVKKDDQEILNGNMAFFETEGTTSNSLEEFMNKEETRYLFDSIASRSPWQANVIENLRKLAPVIDASGLGWLNLEKTPEKPGENSEIILSNPVSGSSDSEWFKFYATLGQRLAIINMFDEKDEALSLLSASEYDEFSYDLTKSLLEADNEMFANMIAFSKNLPRNLTSKTPSPFKEYDELFNESLKKAA